MAITPGSDEERRLLGKWIKKGQGLIVAGSPLGESYLDPKVKREEAVHKLSEEYVTLDKDVAVQLPHLKGRFRYELEKYYRDHWGPYLPKD